MSTPRLIIDAGDGRRWESVLSADELAWLLADARRTTLAATDMAIAAGLDYRPEDGITPAAVAATLVARLINVLSQERRYGP